MKKILSTFLAVLMVFTTFVITPVTVSAENADALPDADITAAASPDAAGAVTDGEEAGAEAALTPAPTSWSGAVSFTDDTTINADVTVTDDAVLMIAEGKTLTVNGTITAANGKTLTVMGPGAFIVNGAKGRNGGCNASGDGGDGVIGSITINGGSVTIVGGYGGNGGTGINGNVTLNGGSIAVSGGSAGAGGSGDIPANAYYRKAAMWAAELGITSGTGEGKFTPDTVCTRLQSIEMIWRAYA